MTFQLKEFNNNDFSPDRKEYETKKIWFMVENSPFNLVSILFMSEDQRDQLFQWVLLQPEKRPPLNINGCGSSQEDLEAISQELLDSIFQHVPKGVADGKHRKGSAGKRSTNKH